jgi:carboxymethylenebutenolidase
MDVWGLRGELFAIARRIAGHGYYCVVPNLFYRHGKIRFEVRNAEGRMASFGTPPQAKQKEMQGYSSQVDRARTRVDIAAVLGVCKAEPVGDGPAGSVGFCLGGRAAFYAGQEFPDRPRANASLHGSWLVTEAPGSPHRLVQRMRGELHCGYGAHDRFATPEIVAAIGQELSGCTDVAYRFHVHPDAGRGYALPERDIHDHAAAKRTGAKSFRCSNGSWVDDAPWPDAHKDARWARRSHLQPL